MENQGHFSAEINSNSMVAGRMVEFVFNTYGFAFERGADQLAETYRVASEALTERRQLLESDLIAYQSDVSAGGEVIGDWEEGYWLWTKDQLLELEIEDVSEAFGALRRAFIIALYHHWERWMRRQFKRNGGGHDDLVAFATKKDLAIDGRLAGVRDLANLFKHSNNNRGRGLLSSWPELLPPSFQHDTEGDWYDAVRLSDEVVFQVAAIVKASGPRSNKTYRSSG